LTDCTDQHGIVADITVRSFSCVIRGGAFDSGLADPAVLRTRTIIVYTIVPMSSISR